MNASRTDTAVTGPIQGIADAAGQLASANRDGVDTIRPLARLLEATLKLPNC